MKMEAKEGREGKRMESWLWCAVRISLVSDSLKFEKKCAIASRVPLPGTEHSLQKRPVTVLNYIGKGKGAIPQLGRRRGAHFSSLGLWARGWINHLSPWRMASATPDLRLSRQPQSITTLWPLVPNYTAWWKEAHACEQLAQGRYLTVPRFGVDPEIFRSPVSLLTIASPSHSVQSASQL